MDLNDVRTEVMLVARREAIKWILQAVLVGVFILLGATLTKDKLGPFYKDRFWYAGGASVAVLCSSILLYKKTSRFTATLKNHASNYLVLEKVVTYEYYSLEDLKYSKKIKLKALTNGNTRYCDRYCWTGKGPLDVQSGVNEQEVLLAERKNIWRRYEIIFHRTVNKGDTIETEVRWTLKDVEKQAHPFASADIMEPTDLLVFVVQLNKNLGVTRATCEVSVDIGAPSAISTEDLNCDENGRFEWRIHNPKLLHHYEIFWTFNPVEASP